MVAFVDDKYKEIVKKYKWNWMKGRGVAAFNHDQTTLLHNLIAPYPRVSFIDGNKLNCRRENLIPWKKSEVCGNRCYQGEKISPKGNVTDRPKHFRFEIHRNIKKDGVRYFFLNKVHYKQKRTKEDALKIAKERAAWVKSMTDEVFLQYVKDKTPKIRTTNEIISDWDCYKSQNFDMNSVYQMGIKSMPKRNS